jgi:hypothetical protein
MKSAYYERKRAVLLFFHLLFGSRVSALRKVAQNAPFARSLKVSKHSRSGDPSNDN